MFPTLFSLGPLELQTLSVFVGLSFLVAAFIFWRKGREDYYPEDQLFDGFLFAILMGFIAARVGYVLLHFDLFNWNVIQWFNISGSPGMSGAVGLFFATLFLYRFAKDKKWDAFEVLDFWSVAVSAGLILVAIGAFFGGVGFGYPTKLPWGMVFPGLLEKHHPLQLYSALFYGGLFIFLQWLESRYRTFRWYRSSKKAAETGFLLCVFIIFASLFGVIVSFFKPPAFELFEINIDRVSMLGALVFGVLLLYTRSGRTVGWKRKKKRLFG